MGSALKCSHLQELARVGSIYRINHDIRNDYPRVLSVHGKSHLTRVLKPSEAVGP